jgi:ABC-2 type transport system ATP-binding protein
MASDLAVQVEGLRKRYGGRSATGRSALDGFDLDVRAGTVHGLLGPNGAGKTTAVRVLATLLRADGGRALVDGYDVARQPALVRERIGLVGQHAAVDEVLGGRDNLVMFGRLFHLRKREAGRRADHLLERFGLADAGGKPVKRYSGGMRRRLDLAASLILRPAVLFLDEPTTGLDPRSRNQVWELVRRIAAEGTTVLLTTQYLDEADRLAERMAVIDHGRVIAEGTSRDLKAMVGSSALHLRLASADQQGPAAAVVKGIAAVEPEIDADGRRVSAPVRDRLAALTDAVRTLDARGIAVEDIALRRPTLDEVFLQMTEVRDERES